MTKQQAKFEIELNTFPTALDETTELKMADFRQVLTPRVLLPTTTTHCDKPNNQNLFNPKQYKRQK